jgi:hypothetical protein
VREALGGESMVHLFSRADTNEDGHLSYAETKKVVACALLTMAVLTVLY